MIIFKEMEDQHQQISQALHTYSGSDDFSLTDLLGHQDWSHMTRSQKFGQEEHLIQLKQNTVLPIQDRFKGYPGCRRKPMTIKCLFDNFTIRVKERYGLEPGSSYLFRRLVCHPAFCDTTSDIFPRFH